MRILVAGDSYMPPRYFAEAFTELGAKHEIEYVQVDPSRAFMPATPSERRLREYQGSPAELVERMRLIDVLVVHGAPVTAEVLDASRELRLVCCARGGPVNVDVEAATSRGISVVNTPGKNADAVADLTLAFLVMLIRRLPRAQRFIAEGNKLRDNWDGAQFFGNDLRRQVLGLIGCGQIGRRVAARARAFGTTVIVYDPYVKLDDPIEQVQDLHELLRRSDFVSLHARATRENVNMIDQSALAMMKPGALLVNTARETLVDETALDAALTSGHLGGAALDVVDPNSDPDGRPHRLLRHDNVILTPHLGGATHETLVHGAEMIASEIARYAAGERVVNVVNITPAAA